MAPPLAEMVLHSLVSFGRIELGGFLLNGSENKEWFRECDDSLFSHLIDFLHALCNLDYIIQMA